MVIRRGDMVKVLLGRDRGKSGKVLSVLPRQGRVLVEGINIVHRHVRPRKSGERGQRVSLPAPLPQSSVQLVCPSCQRASRVSIEIKDGVRQRVCRKCQAIIAR